MKIVQLTTDNREHHRDYRTATPYFGAAPEALLEGFADQPGIEVHVVSCLREKVEHSVRLAENIHYHAVHVPRAGWLATGYLGCLLASRKIISEIRPDIVHGQGTERDCALSALYSGFPNVVTIHGNMAELERLKLHQNRLYGAIASRLENHTLKRTGGVFCNSAYTESLVAPRAKKTWRVSNAIRGVFFSPPHDSGERRVIPRIINVGVISPRKRQLEILKVVQSLHRNGHPVEVLFVGHLDATAPYGEAFRAELRNAESNGIASHTDSMAAGQLVTMMDQCDAMVHFPSEEAFGLVVAEGLARGLRFFGANLGGVRDIAHGVAGASLFDSLQDLEDGIRDWIRQGACRSAGAADIMRNRYHPKTIADAHQSIYSEVLGT